MRRDRARELARLNRWQQEPQWGPIRTWINRDRGGWLRVDNRHLRWWQVAGGLILLGGLGWLKLASGLGIDAKPWIGWSMMIIGAFFLSFELKGSSSPLRTSRHEPLPLAFTPMKTPMLVFESSVFLTVSGEDKDTNPGIYGRSLAIWLTEQLRERGFTSGEIVAEDFGWCIPVKAEGHSLYVTCASTGEKASEWRVFVFAEGGLLARIAGRDRRAESVTVVFSAIRRCLERTPDIHNLREEP